MDIFSENSLQLIELSGINKVSRFSIEYGMTLVFYMVFLYT